MKSESGPIGEKQLKTDLRNVNPYDPLNANFHGREARPIQVTRSSVDNDQGDPFTAVNLQTGNEIKLSQTERLEAYTRLNIQAPRYLVLDVEKYKLIRRSRGRKKQNGRNSTKSS